MGIVAQKIDNVFVRFVEIIGIKLLVILLSSMFLFVGKISQDNWAMVVLTISGLRTLNQAVSIVKTGKAKGGEFGRTREGSATSN